MVTRRPKVAVPDPQVWHDLTSVTQGTYDEMDKLSKKAPSSQLSDLALQRVNRTIREARALMGSHDSYMADLSEFVAAGDNPEVRDAVLVLRDVLQGLKRLDQAFGLTRKQRGF
jgi:hypothetical protein